MAITAFTPRRWFGIILFFYLLLSIAYSVTQPLAEAPDEADHYAYIQYIGTHWQLPQGPTVTQGKHPPLYHGLAAALTAWTGLDFEFLRSNPDAFPLGPDKPPNFFVHTTLESFPWRGGPLAMHLARLLSVGLGAVTLWATWQLGNALFPYRPAIGLLAALFLAALPGFHFISGAINNDNAAGAIGALILLTCVNWVNHGPSLRRATILGVLLGMGLLAKVGTLSLWPLAGLAALASIWPQSWQAFPRRRNWYLFLAQTGLSWGVGLLVASPWLIRNWRLYGDPLAWSLVRDTIDLRQQPLTLADLSWLLRGLHQYFWGRFGPVGQIRLPEAAYTTTAMLSLVLIAGMMVFVWRRQHWTPARVANFAIIGAAPLAVFVGLVRYSAMALGTDQARLLWPALAAIAVWTALGVVGWGEILARWFKRSVMWRWISIWASVMLFYGLWAYLWVLQPAYAPPTAVALEHIPAQPMATFGQNLTLLDASLPESPLSIGEPVPVQLLWRAEAALQTDLRPAVRLIHQNEGWLAAEWNHAPAQGRYSTDRWQPGRVVADPYTITPNPVVPGEYRVEVAVRPFLGDWWLPESQSDPWVLLGTIIYQAP